MEEEEAEETGWRTTTTAVRRSDDDAPHPDETADQQRALVESFESEKKLQDDARTLEEAHIRRAIELSLQGRSRGRRRTRGGSGTVPPPPTQGEEARAGGAAAVESDRLRTGQEPLHKRGCRLLRQRSPLHLSTSAAAACAANARRCTSRAACCFTGRRHVRAYKTLLHLAVRIGYVMAAKMLMAAGAKRSLQYQHGQRVLQEAICAREEAV
ncbi:hypothetical protein QYE76_016806 [Lolium multiflorum]|uniref:Uncharacterized protein n=1 Tax=Lolium multiflorum TaxID=4521 RepID=A0AAD8VFB5_LOLMU|nr:hypothetical protein QYE76_016806 [Lolium multiflorum]